MDFSISQEMQLIIIPTIQYAVSAILSGTIHDAFKKIVPMLAISIPEENRQIPKINIFIPALEGYALNQDQPILQEMFYSLLKNSIDKTREEYNHPAFPKILGQLSYDEITLLSIIYKSDNSHNYKLENNYDIYTITSTDFPTNKLKHGNQFNSYIHHLSDLSLIIGAKETIAAYSGRWDSSSNLLSYVIKLTPFGEQFVESCMSEEAEELLKALI